MKRHGKESYNSHLHPGQKRHQRPPKETGGVMTHTTHNSDLMFELNKVAFAVVAAVYQHPPILKC